MLLTPHLKDWLAAQFGPRIRFDEPMWRHTSLRVGGPADAFVMPQTPEQLKELIHWCRLHRIPYRVMGGGANLLVTDRGIRGVLIVLSEGLDHIACSRIDNGTVEIQAMAGASLRRLCALALRHGLQGMNFALGIPGTVGGAVAMNAGTAYGCMGNVLESLRALLPEGKVIRERRGRLNFSYRQLEWPAQPGESGDERPIILSVTFRLQAADARALKAEAQRIMHARRQRQPVGLASAGSFFKNPAAGQPAGRLIDLAGLKGRRIGGAQISPKHANFIVNTGKASAADVLALMEIAQESVSSKFGTLLEPEVQIVGEK